MEYFLVRVSLESTIRDAATNEIVLEAALRLIATTRLVLCPATLLIRYWL